MTLEMAHQIVSACVAVHMAHMGIEDQPEPLPSLDAWTLADLLEANHMVAAENRQPHEPGQSRSLSIVCDDRLIAALYVACHYHAQDAQHDIDPIASVGDRFVVVLRTP